MKKILLLISICFSLASCGQKKESSTYQEYNAILPQTPAISSSEEPIPVPSPTPEQTQEAEHNAKPTHTEVPSATPSQTDNSTQKNESSHNSSDDKLVDTPPNTHSPSHKSIESIEKKEDSVSITITGPDGVLITTTNINIEENETVFSVTEKALKNSGIALHSRGSKNNKYIEGIGDYYEFDYGPNSGYVYSVNNNYPEYSCSQYQLNDGDTVLWSYKK